MFQALAELFKNSNAIAYPQIHENKSNFIHSFFYLNHHYV